MSLQIDIESCPRCGSPNKVRPKLLLIDETWVEPGSDPRLRHYPRLRVSDISTAHQHAEPLEQFVDGLYCDGCGQGFVPDVKIKPPHDGHYFQ